MPSNPRQRDQRSAEAQAYRHWYWTSRWRRIAKAQLQAEPLCRMCIEQGTICAATVCDHVEPHAGDPDKFWNGPFQSLCKRHHDSTKQQIEKSGFARGNGTDGRPIDPAHPWNR